MGTENIYICKCGCKKWMVNSSRIECSRCGRIYMLVNNLMESWQFNDDRDHWALFKEAESKPTSFVLSQFIQRLKDGVKFSWL